MSPCVLVSKKAEAGRFSYTSLQYVENHLAGKGIPLGQRVVKSILDARDIFPELEHLLLRRRECICTDDHDRRELRAPRRPFRCHTQQLVDMELVRTLDVEDDLFQFGAHYDFFGVFVGIQDLDERRVVALNEHEGMEVFQIGRASCRERVFALV